MLAIIAHRAGGAVSFNKEELDNLPDAAFSINVKDGVYTLKLAYETPVTNP